MTEYYVDTAGIGGTPLDANPGTISEPWEHISKANSTLVAGDTVYLRAGTYTSESIVPANSGTSGNQITYSNYLSEIVTISGGSRHADLTGVNYITIDGIYFYNAGSYWIYMNDTHHSVIQNSNFNISFTYAGIRSESGIGFNNYFNNTFEDSPASGDAQGTNPADYISHNGGSSYNIYDGNHFKKTGHANLAFYSSSDTHAVVRNNTFQNKFHTGLGGGENALIENNFFYDCGEDFLNDPIPANQRRHNPGIQQNRGYAIIRGNVFDNNGAGITMTGSTSTDADSNKIYQNTINKSVRGIYASASSDYESLYNNIFKNNILVNTFDYSAEEGYNVYFKQPPGYRDYSNTWYNNNVYGGTMESYYQTAIYTTSADMFAAYSNEWVSENIELAPLFVDEVNRDFTLQTTSPCLNAGMHLTTITSSTNTVQTTIIVDDASYFYDGWSISGEVGDTIMTAAGEETVIQSINYTTNTLTVSPAIDIVNGEGLSLTYTGTAPNIGEYQGTGETGHNPYDRTRGIFRAPLMYSAIGGRFK